MSTAPQRIHFRAGTEAEWAAANPTLEAAEPGYETDTKRIKVGDGVTPWADLPYGHLNSDPRTINSLGFTLDAALTAAQGQLTEKAREAPDFRPGRDSASGNAAQPIGTGLQGTALGCKM